MNDTASRFSVIGVGAAACLACCAPLLLGFIGSLGIAGFASTLLFGVGGLAAVGLAVAAFVVVRRRHTTCATSDEPAPVAAPRRRTTDEAATTATETLLR